ncbi:MAG TPA: type II toxin-antitoxin system prevent-host-death family antitoxin [Nitrolancea sp.]|jgi:prevent-host-death family protein|nr:type II toxin-antitoxin system prevent-host-death family antitoxin [Nitrolancea sp.]
MSTKVNMHQAKSDLSRLVARALEGEEIIITRAGKPVVRLEPIRAKRVPGGAKGMIRIEPNFDDPLSDEELALFYGDENK